MTNKHKPIKGLEGVDLSEFKTPAELGIRPDEFEYLLKAALRLCKAGDNRRVELVAGQLPHRFNMGHWRMAAADQDRGFDVSYGQMLHGCGTSGCIRGSAETIALSETNGWTHPWQRQSFSPALSPLFLPWGSSETAHECMVRAITPRIAAEATINFLKTGKVKFNIPKRKS
jgi:hypothetical protein